MACGIDLCKVGSCFGRGEQWWFGTPCNLIGLSNQSGQKDSKNTAQMERLHFQIINHFCLPLECRCCSMQASRATNFVAVHAIRTVDRHFYGFLLFLCDAKITALIALKWHWRSLRIDIQTCILKLVKLFLFRFHFIVVRAQHWKIPLLRFIRVTTWMGFLCEQPVKSLNSRLCSFCAMWISATTDWMHSICSYSHWSETKNALTTVRSKSNNNKSKHLQLHAHFA